MAYSVGVREHLRGVSASVATTKARKSREVCRQKKEKTAKKCAKKTGPTSSKKKTAKDFKSWTPSKVEGRWCGFGPYYAMFPVSFARKIVESYCPAGGTVIDPFCGRGTVPFVAMATGRPSMGCDLNPVAWVYAKTKTDPYPEKEEILARARQIRDAVQPADCIPENEFQEYAWSSQVLGYLNAARRLLDWRTSTLDRTLMATLLVHLHAKEGDGLSNQMRQSKSMAPLYSVKWWKARGMLPPDIDVVDFLTAKLKWRYAKGVMPEGPGRPKIGLADARQAIDSLPDDFKADLVFTSPPYCGVTNYRYDNWIRLWLLNEGPAIANGDTKQRYVNKAEYLKLLTETFASCSEKTKDTATVYVRTDAREFTLQATIAALRLAWPNKRILIAPAKFKKATQTALYGDAGKKPGEMDLLLLPKGRKTPAGFKSLPPQKKGKAAKG